MDFGILVSLLIEKTVTFFLDFFLNGLFDFLSGILFGGAA